MILAHFAAVNSVGAKLFLNADELVVFGDAVGAAERAGLDLAGIRCHGDIGDRRIFGFAGAMANDRRVFVFLGEFDGVERLGERADLIDLDQNRIGRRPFRCPCGGTRHW